MYLEQTPLKEAFAVENIMEGEVEIIKSLKEFYNVLYTLNVNEQCSARKLHRIEGSSGDAIFTGSEGKRIPGRQLSLCLTVKSLTGIKTKISLLNRFGHCARDEIKRIDLGREVTTFKTKILVPSHTIRKSNLSVGRAWENFNINIEAPSGANAIHHTCFQKN